MTTNLYIINDEVAEEAGPIFQAKNNGIAIRNYSGVINKLDPRVKQDYSLWCLGTFDSETMRLHAEAAPYKIDTELIPIQEKDIVNV